MSYRVIGNYALDAPEVILHTDSLEYAEKVADDSTRGIYPWGDGTPTTKAFVESGHGSAYRHYTATSQVLNANARVLAASLEEHGFIVDVDGASVAFVREDYPDCSAPASAELCSDGHAAFVTFNGLFAGTQTFSTVDELADVLAEKYEDGAL